MSQETLLDDPNFREFYVTAKKSTYAAGGDKKAEVLRDGGKRYIFYDIKRWPQWRYTDTYYGFNPFFGSEVVYLFDFNPATPAIWMPVAQMSYSGYAKGSSGQVKRMFAFLEETLQIVSLDSFFRGPAFTVTRTDNMEYRCDYERLNPFCVRGRESILLFLGRCGLVHASYRLGFLFTCLC